MDMLKVRRKGRAVRLTGALDSGDLGWSNQQNLTLKNCPVPIPAPRNISGLPEMACHKQAAFGKLSVTPAVRIEQGLNNPAAHQRIPLLLLVEDHSPSSW